LKRDQSKTKEYMSKLIDIFIKCGAEGWVEKYEKEMASLYSKDMFLSLLILDHLGF